MMLQIPDTNGRDIYGWITDIPAEVTVSPLQLQLSLG